VSRPQKNRQKIVTSGVLHPAPSGVLQPAPPIPSLRWAGVALSFSPTVGDTIPLLFGGRRLPFPFPTALPCHQITRIPGKDLSFSPMARSISAKGGGGRSPCNSGAIGAWAEATAGAWGRGRSSAIGGDGDFLHPVRFGRRRPNHGRWPDLWRWRPELGAAAGARDRGECGGSITGERRRREREEREWWNENVLQVGPRGRAGCPRVCSRVSAVCLVDPNVNHIWGGNESSADCLSV
jgi:hypothetical protein